MNGHYCALHISLSMMTVQCRLPFWRFVRIHFFQWYHRVCTNCMVIQVGGPTLVNISFLLWCHMSQFDVLGYVGPRINPLSSLWVYVSAKLVCSTFWPTMNHVWKQKFFRFWMSTLEDMAKILPPAMKSCAKADNFAHFWTDSFPEGIHNVAVTCSHESDGSSCVVNENESLREKLTPCLLSSPPHSQYLR